MPKKQEVGGDGHDVQRGSHGEVGGKEGVCCTVYMCISKEEAKKYAKESTGTKTSKRKLM